MCRPRHPSANPLARAERFLRAPAAQHPSRPPREPVQACAGPAIGVSARGYALLWLLFLIAGLGVGMAALGTMWHTAAQREKEAELLFVGDQYRLALESFWKGSPEGQARLPKTIEELLKDPRFPHTVRHLRKNYVDPMTGKAEWGFEKNQDGGISAVFSLSDGRPYKQHGFSPRYLEFSGAESYKAWVFRFTPGAEPGDGGTSQAASATRGQAGETGTGTTSAGAQRAAQVSACNTQRFQENLACGPLLESDQAAWTTCMSVAESRYRACVSPR